MNFISAVDSPSPWNIGRGVLYGGMNVYFISASSPDITVTWIKVGRARKPRSRLCEMQVGCPLRLSLIGLIRCESNGAAVLLEKKLHDSLMWRHARGEWYVAPANYQDEVDALMAHWNDLLRRYPNPLSYVRD